jgi:hypothetical protein
MVCKIIDCSGAVFAVWGKPSKEDIDRVHEQLERGLARTGQPVVFVTRVPSDAPPPDEEVRKYLSASIGSMMRTYSSYHVILEGTGFLAAIKRGALTSLLQPIWKKKVFHVHATANEVLRALSGDERAAADEVLILADRRGYLDCPAPTAEHRSVQSA